MADFNTEVLVVGGGQCGLAVSENLSKEGIDHIVLEKGRIAERWRSERWDSLVTNGPAWHDHIPGYDYKNIDPDGFVHKDAVADYLCDYAESINAPIKTETEVLSVTPKPDGFGFIAETTMGTISSNYLVSATGRFNTPLIPQIVPEDYDILQMHSIDYKNPEQLPEGAVLVVGAGSSGAQIAEELNEAGRKVYLSMSPHTRPPRIYRSRDIVWWMGVLGVWDDEVPAPGVQPALAATGAGDGKRTIDFRRLSQNGVTLLGKTESFSDGTLHFASDLPKLIEDGNNLYLRLLDAADAFIEKYNLGFPEDPEARNILPITEDELNPILDLDLAEAGITSIIWGTGFTADYGWLQVNTFNEKGEPEHKRGVGKLPGVYFVGLPWLSRRKSSFLSGTWEDARYVVERITTHRDYMKYE